MLRLPLRFRKVTIVFDGFVNLTLVIVGPGRVWMVQNLQKRVVFQDYVFVVERIDAVDTFNLQLTNVELPDVAGYIKPDESRYNTFNPGYIGSVLSATRGEYDLPVVDTLEEAMKRLCRFMIAVGSYVYLDR